MRLTRTGLAIAALLPVFALCIPARVSAQEASYRVTPEKACFPPEDEVPVKEQEVVSVGPPTVYATKDKAIAACEAALPEHKKACIKGVIAKVNRAVFKEGCSLGGKLGKPEVACKVVDTKGMPTPKDAKEDPPGLKCQANQKGDGWTWVVAGTCSYAGTIKVLCDP